MHLRPVWEKNTKRQKKFEVGADNMMDLDGGIQCGDLGCPRNLLVGCASFRPPGFPSTRRMYPSVGRKKEVNAS